MISVENVTFGYPGGEFDLFISELQIEAGDAVAVTGRSGCGKTTLLNLLAGILQPVKGRIAVGEQIVSSMNDARRRDFRLRHVGLVFQDFQLIDYLNVLDNALLPARLTSSAPPDQYTRDRALALLDQAGLGHYLKKSVTRLSQGERQRVAICRSLLLKPTLILADEPTGNLDPRTADSVLQLLMDQARESSATLITVTHDHSLLPAFRRVIPFDRLLGFDPETTVEAGTAP